MISCMDVDQHGTKSTQLDRVANYQLGTGLYLLLYLKYSRVLCILCELGFNTVELLFRRDSQL